MTLPDGTQIDLGQADGARRLAARPAWAARSPRRGANVIATAALLSVFDAMATVPGRHHRRPGRERRRHLRRPLDLGRRPRGHAPRAQHRAQDQHPGRHHRDDLPRLDRSDVRLTARDIYSVAAGLYRARHAARPHRQRLHTAHQVSRRARPTRPRGGARAAGRATLSAVVEAALRGLPRRPEVAGARPSPCRHVGEELVKRHLPARPGTVGRWRDRRAATHGYHERARSCAPRSTRSRRRGRRLRGRPRPAGRRPTGPGRQHAGPQVAAVVAVGRAAVERPPRPAPASRSPSRPRCPRRPPRGPAAASGGRSARACRPPVPAVAVAREPRRPASAARGDRSAEDPGRLRSRRASARRAARRARRGKARALPTRWCCRARAAGTGRRSARSTAPPSASTAAPRARRARQERPMARSRRRPGMGWHDIWREVTGR